MSNIQMQADDSKLIKGLVRVQAQRRLFARAMAAALLPSIADLRPSRMIAKKKPTQWFCAECGAEIPRGREGRTCKACRAAASQEGLR